MALRRLLRGRVPWTTAEGVVRELLDRHDVEAARVEYLEADNWLSTPMAVGDRWFVKIISEQNSLVHALLTTGRNLGALSSGTSGFFQHFGTPYEMAAHELDATRRMRDLGVTAPRPIEAFEYEGHGVLVLEYVPGFESLAAQPPGAIEGHVHRVFQYLRRMHDNGIAHGDFREENVLVADGELYFLDATNVRADALDDARSYDLACALGALAPIVGARVAVDAAAERYTPTELLAAEEFLDFVNLRPDHDFAAATLKGEIEKRATL